jgi:hypothetical protein
MPNFEKVRFITVNYSRLQGLKAVPPGILLFLIILWTNTQTGENRDLTLPLMWCLAGIILYALIDWYYRRTYGRVEQTGRTYWMDVIFSTAFSVIAIGVFVVDTGDWIPVSLFALVFAAGMFLDYLRMLRLADVKSLTIFPVGLLCIAEIALSAFLPLLGEWVWGVFGFRNPMFLVYAVDGIIMVVYGIAGHFYLVRSMLSAGEASHGQPV